MITDGTTFIDPYALAFTLLMGLFLVLLPRRYALIPVIMLACYMTMAQRVLVLGLNFTMLRILMLFGWIRLIVRWEFVSLKLNAIDKVLIWWTVVSFITYVLLWQTWGSVVYRLGQFYNAIGMYFLFRFLVRDFEDIQRTLRQIAFFITPLALVMLNEKITGRNVFAVFGGVSPVTLVREGVLRCQGPFAHPILAGTFGATLFPFFVALWWQGKGSRLLALSATASAVVITVVAGSSGPVIALAFAVLGFCLWPFRYHMRKIRWGLLMMIIALHLVMKAPVWFLIERVSVFGGSAGWHRAYLVDRAIANFSEWWLVGIKDTEHWGYHLFDVTNAYILEGVSGGVLTMILFILIISRGFGGVERTVAALKDGPRSTQFGVWALGVGLLAHVVTFISVTYFDQNYVNWYLLLAMIATVTGIYAPANQPAWKKALEFRKQAHPVAAEARNYPVLQKQAR